MARFRRKAARRSVSRSLTRRYRKASRRSGAGFTIAKVAAAGVYGALRERMSNWITPISSKVPLGNIADEVVLLGGAYMINKKVSNPFVKDVTAAAMIIESARIGEAVANGTIMGGTTSTSPAYKVYG